MNTPHNQVRGDSKLCAALSRLRTEYSLVKTRREFKI